MQSLLQAKFDHVQYSAVRKWSWFIMRQMHFKLQSTKC